MRPLFRSALWLAACCCLGTPVLCRAQALNIVTDEPAPSTLQCPVSGVSWASDQPSPPPDDYQELKNLFIEHAAAAQQTGQPPTSDNRQSQNGAKSPSNQNPGFDPSVVARGQQEFESRCTQCHDAQRSLQKSKSLSGWRATVDRMAGKDGADIPSDVRGPIATYLASLSNSFGGDASGGGGGESASFSIGGTLSPMWRGSDNSNLQNPGFFPMTWVGVNWQGTGPISGRATACISCHNEITSRLELVDAAARVDLTKCLDSFCDCCCDHNLQASIEAGRFIVPFGAFYQQVNPGVYRTVTVPLIYNMGQRVFPAVLPVSVIPMPYSDEGASVNVSLGSTDDINVTFQSYAVNGLQGFTDIDFLLSRDYVDNNRFPTVGGRLTVGNKDFRIGGSVMGGRYNPEGVLPNNQGLNYLLYGADATYRWEDILRLQFEYAQRDNDKFFFPTSVGENHIGGCYVEGEVLLRRCWHLSLVSRYDMMGWEFANDPSIGLPPTKANERVLTVGLNWTLPGGSLLMVGDDHWYLPAPLPNVDVVGVRWATSF
jgi:hypothetical protein